MPGKLDIHIPARSEEYGLLIEKRVRDAAAQRIVLYLRVSTDDQAGAKKVSLPIQERRCREYAAKIGGNVVQVFQEDYTGKRLDRPALNQMMQYLAGGQADTVVVMTLDRLVRITTHFFIIYHQLKSTGVELHFADRGLVTDDIASIIVSTIDALTSEKEGHKIVQRSMEAKLEKVTEQNIPMIARPPYGYRKTGLHEIVIHDAEAAIVRQIFYWAAYGHDQDGEPITTYQIAKELNRQGVPSPTQARPRKTDNLNSEGWRHSGIAAILHNTWYAGLYYYGKTRRMDGVARPVPQKHWKEVILPDELVLVDKETWNLAQKRLSKNQKVAKRGKKRQYLMAGHLYCGACGRSMAGSFYTWSRRYNCTAKVQKHAGLDADCKHYGRSIHAEYTEQLVWEWLKYLPEDADRLEVGLQAMLERSQSELAPQENRLQAARATLADIKDKITRLVTNTASLTDPEVVAIVQEQITTLAGQRDDTQAFIEQLEGELAHRRIDQTYIERVKAMTHQVHTNLENPSYENIRMLLDLFNVRAEFHSSDTDSKDRWLEVSCVFATETLPLAWAAYGYHGKGGKGGQEGGTDEGEDHGTSGEVGPGVLYGQRSVHGYVPDATHTPDTPQNVVVKGRIPMPWLTNQHFPRTICLGAAIVDVYVAP